MEVNNNDPNNNDVMVDHMDEPEEDMGQIVSGSGTSRPELEEDSVEYDFDDSTILNFHLNSDNSDDGIERMYYNSQDEPDFLSANEYDDVSASSESNNESDIEFPNPELINEDSDLVSEDGQERFPDSQPDENENEESSMNEVIGNDSESVDDFQSYGNWAVEDMPSTSSLNTTPSIYDDYNAIKKIMPKYSDKMIFKYLNRNENHDKRLLVTMWDLMHAINRPKSKNEIRTSPEYKKSKKYEQCPVPVPGKPDVSILTNVKVNSLESQKLMNLENRKDYKRVPKRAPITEVSEPSETEIKKQKMSTTSQTKEIPISTVISTQTVRITQTSAAKNSVVQTPAVKTIVAQPLTSQTLTAKKLAAQVLADPVVIQKKPNNSIIQPAKLAILTEPIRLPHPPPGEAVPRVVFHRPTTETTIYPIPHTLSSSNGFQNQRVVKPSGPSEVRVAPIQYLPYSSITHEEFFKKLNNVVQSTQKTTNIIKPATFDPKMCRPIVSNMVKQTDLIQPGTSSSNGPNFSSGAPKNPIVITMKDDVIPIDDNNFTEQELNMDVRQEIEKMANKDVFNQLTTMFDKVRREYILRLCLKYENVFGKAELLNHLIDVLLEKSHLYQKNEAEEMQKVSLQDKYNDLLEIFPDADPEYLRSHASRYLSDPNKFKEFVQMNLENRNYPTKEQYLKKQKVRQQLEQYITNFNVVQFLEIFPKPFEYFEDPKRSSNPELSLNYLKKHYNKMRIDTIQKTFRKCNQNLSLTVKELDNVKDDLKNKRNIQTVATENIPFAQEVAFIRHRKEIASHLANIAENESREYSDLKESGGLLECQCCYNDECVPSKCASCDNGHVFCYSCIIAGTDSKMADGDTHVKCFVECDREFSLSVLQKVLKPTKFSILLIKRQEAEVKAAGLEGLVSCPFCHFASIPPAEDKVFKCLNQDCMKETCRTCKELNHVPLSCEEAKASDSARHLLEEQMTDALIRICYNCKKPFFKEEGCNKMTCTCGAKMCYICGQPVKDYSHFRGQGSDALSLCPLYTDDAFLNAAAVRRAAEITAKNLISKNPNVKLEAEKLMPLLPAPKSGPHNQIVRPLNLPEHAIRARPYNENH